MTALENVMVGADARSKVGLLNALFRTPLHRRTEAQAEKAAFELLDFVGVSGRADELADEPLLRRPASSRDRPGDGDQAEASVPRRAGGGLQPCGEGNA